MLSKPMDVLTAFPVRKTKKQKQAFRNALHSYCQQLGYAVKEEKGSCGAVNLVFGDPDRAKVLVTAHYDTCAGMPFPNLITPCNFFVFLAYQLLLVAMIFGAYLALREGFGFAVPLYPFVAVCAFLFGLTGIVIGAKPVWLRVWLEKAKEKTWLRYGSCIYFVLTGLCALIALILNEII